VVGAVELADAVLTFEVGGFGKVDAAAANVFSLTTFATGAEGGRGAGEGAVVVGMARTGTRLPSSCCNVASI
jgi:hypothetical protein